VVAWLSISSHHSAHGGTILSPGCKTSVSDNFGRSHFLQKLNRSIRAHIHEFFLAILIHFVKLLETGSVCVACKTPHVRYRSVALSARVCLHTEARPYLHFRLCRSVQCFQSCKGSSIMRPLLDGCIKCRTRPSVGPYVQFIRFTGNRKDRNTSGVHWSDWTKVNTKYGNKFTCIGQR